MSSLIRLNVDIAKELATNTIEKIEKIRKDKTEKSDKRLQDAADKYNNTWIVKFINRLGFDNLRDIKKQRIAEWNSWAFPAFKYGDRQYRVAKRILNACKSESKEIFLDIEDYESIRP